MRRNYPKGAAKSGKNMKRIDNLLANSGKFTRSEARKAVAEGRVSVNGKKALSPSEKADENAVVEVDGISVNTEKNVYLMMNKPRGYVCENGAENDVLSLVPKEYYRKNLFTVGRLDKDTEGLLLITNDGDFAHAVAAPKKNIEKLYFAVLEREVDDDDITAFENGIETKNGEKFLPAKLEKAEGKGAFVTVREGRFHEVKRLFAATGNRVTELKRLKTGELELDVTLEPGQTRELTKEEKELIVSGN